MSTSVSICLADILNDGKPGVVEKSARVSPGDSVRVRLTCARKTRRTDSYGEVAWNVTLYNQDAEQVAQYELLTMVSYTM